MTYLLLSLLFLILLLTAANVVLSFMVARILLRLMERIRAVQQNPPPQPRPQGTPRAPGEPSGLVEVGNHATYDPRVSQPRT